MEGRKGRRKIKEKQRKVRKKSGKRRRKAEMKLRKEGWREGEKRKEIKRQK